MKLHDSFKSKSVITLKRKLKNGNTIKTSHQKGHNFNKINSYIKKLTMLLKPFGPLNFQLCLTEKGPVIFEINPRFSGTTPIRSIYGINEFKILFNYFNDKKYNISLKYGTVIRYFENFFLEKKYF